MIVNLIEENDDSLTDISGTITEPIDFGWENGGGRRMECTTENRKPPMTTRPLWCTTLISMRVRVNIN